MRDWKSFVAQERTLFFLSWAYRYGVAMLVIAYYKQLQEGDILAYFHDLKLWQTYLLKGMVKPQALWQAASLPAELKASLWLCTQPRAHAFVLCLLPFWLLCGGIEALFVAVVTGAGHLLLWYFFRCIRGYYPSLRGAAFVALFLLPSMSIWTTPPLKESLLIPAVYYVYACLLYAHRHKRLSFVQLVAMGGIFLLLWVTKYYYLAALLPFALIWLLLCFYPATQHLSFFKLLLLGISAAFAFVYWLPYVHPNLSPGMLIEALWQNHRDIVRLSNPDNVFWLPFKGSFSSLLLSVPLAVVSGLFRPFLWDATPAVAFIFGTECLVPAASLIVWIKRKAQRPALSLHMRLLLGFIIINAVFLAIAAPNISALSRYRLIYWALWWLICASVLPSAQSLTRRL